MNARRRRLPDNRSRLSARTISLVIVLLSVAALPGSARAGNQDPLAMPTDPEAVRHLQRGDAHFRIREFKEAIDEYRDGARIEPGPRFLYNIAQSFRQLKDYENALWYFKQWLIVGDPPDEMRVPIEQVMQELLDEMNAVATTKPPTDPADDNTAKTAAATDLPEPDRPRSRFTGKRKVALAVGAGGLVAAGAGVLFGLRASGFQDDAAALCPDDACDQASEANALLDRGQRSALYANIGYGVGAAALVGAAVLWFTGGPESNRPASAPKTAVTPRLSGGFAGLDVSVRF